MWLLDKLKQHTIYKQFVPSNKDLESKKLEALSKRLVSNTKNKTLTNILEWQDRNIIYWKERAYTSSIITFLVMASLIFIIYFFGSSNPKIYWLLVLIPILIIGEITFNLALYLIVLLVSLLLIPLSLSLISPTINLNSHFLVLFIGASFILGAFISVILNMIMNYKSIKQFLPEFKIEDTFKMSLSIEKILDYHFSICRDYAKLTSALLLKIYPKDEIYFILIPSHVAVVVKSNKKLFVIDQKLPILSLDKWIEKWRLRFKQKTLKAQLIQLYLQENKIKIKSIKQDIAPYNLENVKLNELNNIIKKLFKLDNENPKIKPSLEIPFKNLERLFSNEDLFKLSFIELIKNKIEDELVGNLEKLENLEIIKRKRSYIEDLVKMKTIQKLKQTEIGEIPEDWDVISFGTAFNFLQSATYSRADLNGNGDLLYVHYGDIHTKWTHFLDLVKNGLPSIPKSKQKNYPLIKEGDLIIADASEDYEGICKSVEVKNLGENKAISGLHTFLLRDKDNYFVNGFRGYIISNKIVKNQLDRLATGLKVYGVSKGNLKVVLIPLPSPKEQSAIAQVLSDTDTLIESLNKLIEKKKNIKQGTMQQLLTGKKRLKGFTGEWEEKRLRQITKIPVTDGPHLTPQFLRDGIPFLSVNNIVNNKVDFSDLRYISKSDDEIFSRKCKPKRGDILMGKAATVGTVAVVDFDLDFNIWSPLALIRVNENQDPKFIYYCLQSPYLINQVKFFTNSSSQGNIGMGDIEKLNFLIPSKNEQTAIAQVLSDMDAEIVELERKRDKYMFIKKGMMQELLTGRIRLPLEAK